ncbi:hypothetical protein HL658_23420 [Azospirillum sp. RWY-5-1]|uniref:Uncharacterized protein n=1 Tax=Azospirillum oleiclasticum TaxID=2735135 RepID=A0ABX2TH90_9PROT|nr:hypothetical protein [Azospirillum oleiclasticum]NYZ15500.1 hypothetical protein [Azospirillum oleiclasticum]NYZ22523.1 hypothetical protein [Azospirillum oleiclasticum]
MLTLASEELRNLRKRFLKPLLAPALSGEPWKPALDPDADPIDAAVIAASVVSYASRCYADWADLDTRELLMMVELSAAANCGHFGIDQWPFVHALSRMLQGRDRAAIEPLVAAYQQRYRACLAEVDAVSGR